MAGLNSAGELRPGAGSGNGDKPEPPHSRASAKELHRTRFQIVHCAGDLDGTLGTQLRKHGAVFPDIGHSHLNILARDSIHKSVILRRALARVGCRLHCGLDLGQ
jgi:hypothetical protein